MALTIAGETGKALNASVRTPALLKIRDLELRTENVAEDTLTWTARTQDLLGSMTILPDEGQVVSLFQDGTRIFHGHVSDPRDIDYGTRVTVQGPWWWLRRTQLTQPGTAGDRPTLELAEATAKSMITTLLTRAIAKGVPIRIGTIMDTLTLSKQQFSETNFADALADLLRWIADGVAWWDYSSGLPAFNLTRRSGALNTTYAIGSGDGEIIERELQPISEGRVDRVELTFMTRNSVGQPVQQQQASGSAAAGRTQVIAISGPERDTFVPPDDYSSYTLQTANANDTLNNLRARILPLLSEVVASRAQFAGRPTTTDVILANGESITMQASTSGSGGTFVYNQPTLKFIDVATGLETSRVGKNFVLGAAPPEWAEQYLTSVQKVKIVGRIYVLEESTLYDINGGNGQPAPTPPAWQTAFPWSLVDLLDGKRASSTIINRPWATVRLKALDFEIETLLTTSTYATPTEVAKPQAFDYLVPPAGMAAGLLAMQNFTPWKGRIVRKGSACDGLPLMHRKFNVTGGRPALATMGALPKAVTFDFRSKRVTIELGPPSRHDVGTIVQRFRVSPQTNIKINNA
jgi:hypothetical protein